MFRVLKFGLLALLAYVIATAAPTQQVAIIQGARALGDAVIDACTREGSPCRRAIALLAVGLRLLRQQHQQDLVTMARCRSDYVVVKLVPSLGKPP